MASSQNNKKLKMIDLFCGTGAFTYAFEKTGNIECVFSNDMVAWSKEIYDANFNHKVTLGNLNDIKVENIPKHDILTGGFPCQPFSIAGKQDGFQDERSNVFWKILSIIDYHKPSCVILENVKNLVSHDEGKTFEIIKKNLIDREYNIHFKVLNTSQITGIPQHRERIYIVCIKSKEVSDKFNLDFPDIKKATISSLLEKEDVIADKYYYTDKSSTWELVKNSVIKNDTVYQYRRVYVRENKSNECPTLTANMGGGGHNVPLILDNKGIRKLTPRECFHFQGFPSSYKLPSHISDTNLYKLAGNAVSVPVVQLIANRLIPLLLLNENKIENKNENENEKKQDTGKFRTNIKDQFYTNVNVAKSCIQNIIDLFPFISNYVWLEPSAGDGAFFNNIPSTFQKIGIDIDPHSDGIIKQDFLEWELNTSICKDKDIIAFGNPPFGRQSSQAKAFISKCCKFANIIAFILPKSFTKPSMYNVFDLKFHLVKTIELEKNSFVINGTPYDVPCVFQIWLKKNVNRLVEQKINPVGFQYVKSNESYHIAFRRVGGNAGKCYMNTNNAYEFSEQSHYFIMFNSDIVCHLNTIIKKINNHTFPSNTLGPRSLSKTEANVVINHIIQSL